MPVGAVVEPCESILHLGQTRGELVEKPEVHGILGLGSEVARSWRQRLVLRAGLERHPDDVR
jgi:hypothetical protein